MLLKAFLVRNDEKLSVIQQQIIGVISNFFRCQAFVHHISKIGIEGS